MNTPLSAAADDLQLVTFSMGIEGHWVVVEEVPARVDALTGERFFDLATVDKIQQLVRQHQPVRVEQLPVSGLRPELFWQRKAPRSTDKVVLGAFRFRPVR